MTYYVALIVAALGMYLVGWIWYGYLFRKPWARLMGVEHMPRPGKREMIRSMIGGFVSSLVMVYALGVFMNALLVGTLINALLITAVIVLGFIATVLSNAMWYERKSWKLWLINVGHYLVALSVAVLILFYW